uniref:Uncharacterized protein n=1 Tax=Arundo donax TaxID=35708 RepID=A0A0A8Z185_ARUDO
MKDNGNVPEQRREAAEVRLKIKVTSAPKLPVGNGLPFRCFTTCLCYF